MTESFTAKKKFGQHFLNSPHIIDKITSDISDESKYILEIGPGPGVLTKKLIEKENPLKVVEIDDQFISFLSNLVGAENVLHIDAMEVDLAEKFKAWSWDDNIWLVSNLPYNVAAPLMINFFPMPQIQSMTLMMQKEMAQRVLPTNKKKPSNPLSVYAALFFEVKVLCQVPPGAFQPPPKVDSTVLSFRKKETSLIARDDFGLFKKFARALFTTPRKQMKKVLTTNLALSNGSWEELFNENDIPMNIRAEALELEKILSLFFSWKRGIQ